MIRDAQFYLNTVFKAVELPARITDLDTGLPNVDRDALSHVCFLLGTSTCCEEKSKTESLVWIAEDVYEDD